MKRNRSDGETTLRPAAGAALMQPAVTTALTRSLFVEWARCGYAALSLEAVARRAGVGKAALYRRWPSKLEFVVDRLEQVGMELALPPDTGSLRGDITALLRALRRLLRRPLVALILPDLHAEMLRSPRLAGRIREKLQIERRQRAAAVIHRAVQRGELPPDVDVEIANDALGGLIYWRAIITSGPTDDAYIDRLTDFVLAGLGSR